MFLCSQEVYYICHVQALDYEWCAIRQSLEADLGDVFV